MTIADRVSSTFSAWHPGRYREVLGVLVRFGLSDFVDNLGRGKITVPRISPASLSQALCELGPAFIKLGQILATRDDLLSPRFRDELAKLQDQVPPFSMDLVKTVVESELSSRLSEIFAEFDPVPLASGSIGQVHRGRLLDGTEVIVKVQRPGVEQILARDSAIIKHLSEALGNQPEMGDHATRLISEFLASTESELDYSREADQLERFAWQFEHDPGVRIPQVIRNYSTKRALTLTYIPGVKLSQIERLGLDVDRKYCARRLANNVLKQIFAFGYFHGDPHPANVFVQADQSIGFYDFGLIGELSRSEREYFAALLLALLHQDPDAATGALICLATSPRPRDTAALKTDVSQLTTKYFRYPSSDTAVDRLLRDILRLTERHSVILPPSFYLVFKVLATLESVTRLLDPHVNLLALAIPVLERAKPPGPARELDTLQLFDVGLETLAQLRGVPAALCGTLTQLNQGQLRVQLDHRGLDPALTRYERATTRLSSAVLTGAITLGASVILGFAVGAGLLNPSQAGIAGACVLLLSLLLMDVLSRLGIKRAGREL